MLKKNTDDADNKTIKEEGLGLKNLLLNKEGNSF